MNKKVLHLALQNPFYVNGIGKGFEANDYEVHEADYGKLLRNAGLVGCWARLFRQCEELQPDLIFINCNRDGFLFPAEVKELNNYAPVILYTFDCREENSWIKDIAPHLSLICFSDMDNVKRFNSYGFNAEYLQVSCDIDFYKPVIASVPYGEIIFIGNNYANTIEKFPLAKHRVEMVNFMKKNFGERFKVYGRGWQNADILNPEQEREAYSSCKVAITHNQFERGGYSSDRDFKSMSCGAFTVCHYYDYIDSQFYSWSKFTKLKSVCVSALVNDYTRKKTASEMRQYVLKNHSWDNRIKQLKLLINKIGSVTNT